MTALPASIPYAKLRLRGTHADVPAARRAPMHAIDLAHDDHQSFNFLFRLRQPGNNCGNFIEGLVPAR